jgi:hypothetical protein
MLSDVRELLLGDARLLEMKLQAQVRQQYKSEYPNAGALVALMDATTARLLLALHRGAL